MIPRIKLNYSINDILSSFLISENSLYYQTKVIKELSKIFGTSSAILAPSGRGALYILLSCLPHRKVLLPAYTCKAVIEASLHAKKEIIFLDCEPGSFNIDTQSIPPLDNQTIIIATHQYGIPCSIKKILEIAKKSDAYIIEDCAASFGTKFEGKLTGTFGQAAFFSFDSSKLLNTPLKAGFLITKDALLFKKCQSFYQLNNMPMPITRKYIYLIKSWLLILLENHFFYRLFHNLKFKYQNRFTDEKNFLDLNFSPFYFDKIAEFQAKILYSQLPFLDKMILKRRKIYSAYRKKLKNCSFLTLPPEDKNKEWVPIRFPIKVHGRKLDFYKHAAYLGIDFSFSFTFLASPKQFIVAHKISDTILNLPFYDKLNILEFKYIVKTIKKISDQFSRKK